MQIQKSIFIIKFLITIYQTIKIIILKLVKLILNIQFFIITYFILLLAIITYEVFDFKFLLCYYLNIK